MGTPNVHGTEVKKGLSLFVASVLTGVLLTYGGCAVGAGAGKEAGPVRSPDGQVPISSVIAGVPFLPQ